MTPDANVYTRHELLKFLREQGFNRAAATLESIVANEKHLLESQQDAWRMYHGVRQRLERYEPRPVVHGWPGKPSDESDG